jgi:4-hydroxy-tetrahydrodipicolinate synthase
MKKDFSFKGVMTALITPFQDGYIDFSSLKKLICHQLENKIQGFVVSGTTAEAATLSLQEKIKLLEFVLGDVSGSVPVIMGSGTFNTAESCELAKTFEKYKADALLVVTPYYSKPPQRGMFLHYKEVCQSTNLPVIAYNVPSRTSISLDAATVLQIHKECPNLIGVKEAAGKLETIAALKESMPHDFLVLSGDDATFVGTMEKGAQGVISVISHVCPKICVEAATHVQSKGIATDFTNKLSEISLVLFCESNPVPVKWALTQMGIIKNPSLRLPLVELDKSHHALVLNALKNLGVL